MSDSNFIKFQEDFYDLLEQYGVKEITCEHENFLGICKIRNKVVKFIEKEIKQQGER